MRSRFGFGARCVAGLALALSALASQAHVYRTKTLHDLVSEADLVLRARITRVLAPRPAPSDSAGSSRPSVEAEPLEVLKGRFDEPRVRFAQHGHGVAQFEPGEETLLFLLDIARSRELDALARAGAYDWVSLQEHDDEYAHRPDTRGDASAPLLAAVRDYVAADAAPSLEARSKLLRGATRELITSGDSRLAASALRDLAAAPTLPLVTSEDLPALESVLDDPTNSMGVRVALLAELERRGLVEGLPRWLQLLSAPAPSRDRVTVIRAAGSSASPRIRDRLVSLLADGDVNVAAAAAIALGAPDNAGAVKPLVGALSNASPTVRTAAIRGLGKIATPDARHALEAAARSHPDAKTRRRAQAEVRKRGAGTALD